MTVKICYLVWSPKDLSGDALRDLLTDTLRDEMIGAGAREIVVYVHDSKAAETPSPAPGVPFERRIDAMVTVKVDDVDARWPVEDVLRARGLELAGYLVDETVYTDYGGNPHARPRTWPDGERSPGVTAITMMERPKRLAREEWLERWHGRQSPMSEAMQPRTRYVRNVVVRPLSPGYPPYEGIVEEAWPSHKHVTDPFLFYGAGKNPLKLVKNMAIMLHSVMRFLDMWKIRNVMTSEYFVKTTFRPSSR